MCKQVITKDGDNDAVIKTIGQLYLCKSQSPNSESIKAVVYELINNAKRYGNGDVTVSEDEEDNSITVTNDGGIYESMKAKKKPRQRSNRNTIDKKSAIVDAIYYNEETDEYGLYSIISDITSFGGSVTIASDGYEMTFVNSELFSDTVRTQNTQRIPVDGLVKIKIKF